MNYKLGDTWSRTFDYDGMLQKGTEASVKWSIEDLQLLYNSFEDVNYHKEAGHLWAAIQELKKGHVTEAARYDIDKFNSECEKTLSELTQPETKYDTDWNNDNDIDDWDVVAPV
jgi:hypothetical protein|tara:strand:+ start:935 stop:1276 length:342 start_codon:yes stop_codon:yes gene_type:complete